MADRTKTSVINDDTVSDFSSQQPPQIDKLIEDLRPPEIGQPTKPDKNYQSE